jgi:hypothetical protein
MYTIKYRTFYIHGYCDKNEVTVTWPSGKPAGKYKSLLSAKQAITKSLRKAYGYSNMSEQYKRFFGFK